MEKGKKVKSEKLETKIERQPGIWFDGLDIIMRDFHAHNSELLFLFHAVRFIS